jgi:hypothetical protein
MLALKILSARATDFLYTIFAFRRSQLLVLVNAHLSSNLD